MDPAEAIEQQAMTRQRAMNAVIDYGDSPVQQFYRGTTVLVTGGSGFLGKQLIEKLFRSTQIKKMLVLIRHKKDLTPEQRIFQVLQDPIFNLLYKNQPDFVQKIIPIEGDVAEQELGISSKDRELIINKVNIIFHVAANVKLDQELKSAILTNVRGTRDLINLAKQCKNLKSFIYVSTAFSNATKNKVGEDVKEEFYPAPISPDLMIKLAEGMEEDKIKEIQVKLIQRWPNTYTFSKVLAEDIVRVNSEEVPIKVIRPTIVICTNREPHPGWIDISSVFGPSGLLLGCVMGVLHLIISRKEVKIDLVPSDYVINAAIVAAAAKSEAKVYQVGSSNRNPLLWGQLADNISIAMHELPSPKVVWYSFRFETSSMWKYKIGNVVLHMIPAYIADAACVLVGTKPRLTKLYTTVDRLQNVLQYFTTHDWRYIDNNTEELYNSLCERDRAIYHCDVADIDWTHQILLWSVGLRKYIVKDDLKGTDKGLKRQFYFKIITYIIVSLLGLSGYRVLNVILKRYSKRNFRNLLVTQFVKLC